MPAIVAALAACLAAVNTVPGPASAAIWKRESGAAAGERFPAGALVFTLDRTALAASLAAAPEERTGPSAVDIGFPMPDGTWENFTVHRSVVLHPDLAAKYPEIRTYRAIGRDTRWRARFELSPRGFEASIWTPAGRVQIEPAPGQDRYAVAYLADFLLSEEDRVAPTCEVEADPATVAALDELTNEFLARGGGVSHGDMLRTYLVAIAATGEYSAQHGGTVAGALAQQAETVNRINEIMGVDWAVNLTLHPDNDLIIYTNAATDPYTNGNTGAMLDENQDNLDTVLGLNNFDFGHVFGTGGGGVAALGGVCVNTIKARGVSTLFATGGEAFALLAAHEMGHQFSCQHSFNGTAGNCGPNRSANSAYEPGSGSTIMSYAGTCGSDNIQNFSDAYYHTQSSGQAITHITVGAGAACATTTPTGNTPPAVTSMTVDFWVPLDTPWQMDGTASDADGDSLTYCWEEYDLGPAGDPDIPSGTAPIFRSFLPTTATDRYLPRLSRIITGNQVTGEILPTYQRRVRFRLTARDGLGGTHWDQGRVDSDSTSGPFRVTSQSTPTTWQAGSQETITWDVANTTNAIVNCQTVNILLRENGLTFPHVLATNTPNDGSEVITVPNVSTTLGRVMVRAADNLFLDVNGANITIELATDVALPAVASASLLLEPGRPNPFAATTSFDYAVPRGGRASLRIYDTAGRLVRVLLDESVVEGRHRVEWDGRGASGERVASGIYFARLETEQGSTGMQKVHLLR
jgi:hypothetical protein